MATFHLVHPSPPNAIPIPLLQPIALISNYPLPVSSYIYPIHHIYTCLNHIPPSCLIRDIAFFFNYLVLLPQYAHLYTPLPTPAQMAPISFGRVSHSISSCHPVLHNSFVVFMIHMFINLYDFVVHVLTSFVISV